MDDYNRHLETLSRASGLTHLNFQDCGNPTLEYLHLELLAAHEFFRDLKEGTTAAHEERLERYHEALSDILSLFVFMAGWDFSLVDEALDLLAENMDKFPTGVALVERIEQRKGETR